MFAGLIAEEPKVYLNRVKIKAMQWLVSGVENLLLELIVLLSHRNQLS